MLNALESTSSSIFRSLPSSKSRFPRLQVVMQLGAFPVPEQQEWE